MSTNNQTQTQSYLVAESRVDRTERSYQNPPQLSPFEQLVKRHELTPTVAKQLKEVLSTCKIVLLCDDSGSMANTIAEEGTDPFAAKKSTRWLELKKLAAVIIEFVIATNDIDGLDIYFMNRPAIMGVKNMVGLQAAFAGDPTGATPLIGSLNSIYQKYNETLNGKSLLIVVITDGEPSDGDRNKLFRTLQNITSNGRTHVSFAECTDNEEDMEYLDAWDGQIKNFDNTDDYREELRRVKAVNGQSFKFDYTDYVIKILLATFVRWYYNLDQGSRISNSNRNNNNDDCCTIL